MSNFRFNQKVQINYNFEHVPLLHFICTFHRLCPKRYIPHGSAQVSMIFYLGIIWVDHLLLYLIGTFGMANLGLSIQYGMELTYPQSVPIMSCITGELSSAISRKIFFSFFSLRGKIILKIMKIKKMSKVVFPRSRFLL